MVNATEKDRVSKDCNETTGLPEWHVLQYAPQTLPFQSFDALVNAHQQQNGNGQETAPHDYDGEGLGILQILETQGKGDEEHHDHTAGVDLIRVQLTIAYEPPSTQKCMSQ